MHKMRHFLIAFLACALVFGAVDVQAQTGKKKKKSSKAKTEKTDKKTKKKTEEPAVPAFVQLPANSNDCLFPITLEMDVPYGPTTAPDGAGRIQEIVVDKAHPNIFEREHNSVWYKFTVPYNGELEIAIWQQSPWDDYDFLVYRYTDVYFSNRLIENKLKPLAADLSSKDTAGLYAATPKNSKGQVTAKPRSKRMTSATMGMKADGKRYASALSTAAKGIAG